MPSRGHGDAAPRVGRLGVRVLPDLARPLRLLRAPSNNTKRGLSLLPSNSGANSPSKMNMQPAGMELAKPNRTLEFINALQVRV